MFKWIKKKIFKSIVKDIANELPEIKEKALDYLEDNKDELLNKCKEVIKNFIQDFINKKK